MLVLCAIVFIALIAIVMFLQRARAQKPGDQPTTERTTSMSTTQNPTSNPEKTAKMSDEELRKKLTPEQYRITQMCGTEPAFHNAYWNEHRAGIYVDIVTGEPLFSSLDKFDSGSGWPSFTKPIEKVHVTEKTDRTSGWSERKFAPRKATPISAIFLTTVPARRTCVTASTPARFASFPWKR